MEVCTIKVKSPEKKRKQKSDSKEAVRKRLNRLRENPDVKALLAEELEKASGGELTGVLSIEFPASLLGGFPHDSGPLNGR
jgi:hypothetical protein